MQKLVAVMLSIFVVTNFALAEPPPTHVYVQVQGMACPFCV
jgi:hypothetical protein